MTSHNEQYSARLSELEFGAMWYELPEVGEQIDPFELRQRMGAYKLLIDQMNSQEIFGAQNEWNVFWGYVFQLHWQWRTGRLRDAETLSERIAAESAWGYANYSLSIVPLVGAMQVGMVREKEILTVDSPLAHIRGGGRAGAFQIPALFDAALREWREFFTLVMETPRGGDIEPIRFKQWRAHFRSLVTIESFLLKLDASLSQREGDFLTGWIRMVDFLGAAAWHTDLEFMLENGVNVLPERMLTDQDIPGQIPDMDALVNSNVFNIVNLAHLSKRRFDFNLWLWKRGMRTRAAREQVVKMLDATFNPSPRNAAERRKLLGYVLAW